MIGTTAVFIVIFFAVVAFLVRAWNVSNLKKFRKIFGFTPTYRPELHPFEWAKIESRLGEMERSVNVVNNAYNNFINSLSVPCPYDIPNFYPILKAKTVEIRRLNKEIVSAGLCLLEANILAAWAGYHKRKTKTEKLRFSL